jgi:predicted HicB family RNase H-like nuclease
MIDIVAEERVYQAAYELFSKNPDWVTFFREILGLEGVVRRNFPTPDGLAEFERTETFRRIQQMLSRLRHQSDDRPVSHEPLHVITIRMPESLHEALKVEAHEYRTSMNKLCISKLLQFVESELVPADSKKPVAAS